MDLENAFPSLDVRQRHHNLTIDATWAQKSRIQYIGTVGRSNENDSLVGFEPVHFDQQLIQGLFSFVVASSQTGTAMPSNGVEFINKDDAGSIFLPLLKKVSDPTRPHADEHLNKIRSADAEKGNAGFSCDGPSHKSLPRPGRTHQEYALGDSSTQLLEFLRFFQELNDFLKFLLRFLYTSHILEGNLLLGVRR